MGGGGQSAGGNNNNQNTDITSQNQNLDTKSQTSSTLGVVTPSVELTDTQLDTMFGEPNQDHLKKARDKIVAQFAIKGKKLSIYGYTGNLGLDNQDCNAIARQLLGLRKSYAMRFNAATNYTKVMVPSADGKSNKAVACKKATINDINSGINEE